MDSDYVAVGTIVKTLDSSLNETWKASGGFGEVT